MIQDIGNKHFNNQYDPTAVATGDDYAFLFRNGILIGFTDNDIIIPKVSEFGLSEEDMVGKLRYLFSIDEDRYFMLEDSEDLNLPEGYNFESMRALRMCTARCMAGMTAHHLVGWYRDNKFCGRCGTLTEHDDKLRMVKCPNCGNMIFPRINPAVIVGVRDGDRLVTSKYANRPQSNGRALLAGFCEIGETAEETVAREVMEEELACADFMTRNELPEPDNMVSLTATMIKDFKEGKY